MFTHTHTLYTPPPPPHTQSYIYNALCNIPGAPNDQLGRRRRSIVKAAKQRENWGHFRVCCQVKDSRKPRTFRGQEAWSGGGGLGPSSLTAVWTFNSTEEEGGQCPRPSPLQRKWPVFQTITTTTFCHLLGVSRCTQSSSSRAQTGVCIQWFVMTNQQLNTL